MSRIRTRNNPQQSGHGLSIAETVLKVPMAWLAAMFLAVAPASADDDAPLKKGGFQLSVGAVEAIAVNVSADRTEGEILSTPMTLQLHGKIDFKWGNGYLEKAGLFAGKCARTACGPTHKLLWYRSQSASGSSDGGDLPDNDWTINLSVPTTPDRMLPPLEQMDLIQTCKQNPQAEFVHWTTVTLSANTRTDDTSLGEDFVGAEESQSLDEIDFNGGDQSRHADFAVLVQCALSSHTESPPVSKTPDNIDVGFDHGAMKVNDIRMTLTTYSDAHTQPTPGTQCKKAKLRVTMETNQAGLASFKLWEQRGDGGVESEDVIVGAHHEDGRFLAVHERWISVDETTHVQFNARDLVNETFSHETGWKDITLHCAGTGSGGLQTPTDDDNGAVQPAAFEGNFQFIDNGPLADRNTCPRDGKALVWFNAPKPDNIHYSLDCGALGNFSGVLQPEQIGQGHYRAGTLINFEVANTIEAGCTLRTVSPGDARDHAFAAHTFQCAKTAGHSSEIGGLTGGQDTPGGDLPTPRPKPEVNPAIGGGVGVLVAEPDPTHAPKKVVDPVRTNPEPKAPQIVCTGGKVSKGKCLCGQNKIVKKTGANQFQCLAIAKPPEKTKPVRVTPAPKKAKLVCKGGKASGGKCLCGQNAKRVKLGANAFACQKKKAVRAETKPAQKVTQPKRVNPAPKKQKLVCKGGKASGGKCLCGKKKAAKKLGQRRFACVPRRG